MKKKWLSEGQPRWVVANQMVERESAKWAVANLWVTESVDGNDDYAPAS